jgi:precorrin-4 methylase
MLIRMTFIGTHIAAVLAAGAVATGAVFAAEAGAGRDAGAPTALVVDASLARDGRELVDARLKDVDAEVRLPRDAEEAGINVRYFDELDYHVYVAGARATEAATEAGVEATPVDGLAGALAAAR